MWVLKPLGFLSPSVGASRRNIARPPYFGKDEKFFFFLTDNYILLIKITIEIRIKLN